MCVRVGLDVCVVGWAFMYVCKGGHSCVCVLGWTFMCVC